MQRGLKELIGHWGSSRFGGRLLESLEDEWGEIQVIERKGERSLHFDRPEKQSAMSVSQPDRLILDYTQAMMCSLALLDEEPQRVLFIGLGGGSMVKYLLQRYPNCRVDAVELRESVVQLAQEHFGLLASPRLNLIIADVKDYLVHAKRFDYDLVLVDAFDKEGVAESVQGPGFFRALGRLVSRGGLVALNLWTEPQSRYQINHYHLAEVFDRRILSLMVPERTNKILFAFGAGAQPPDARSRQGRAKQLEPHLGLGLPHWVAKIQPDPFGK
ncbi:MAG: methyltransferase domain-containing protein [bacterium]|nr:methyltransferase domain-containing protein [bacterium]